MSQGMEDTSVTATLPSKSTGDVLEAIKRPTRTYGRRREQPEAGESALTNSLSGGQKNFPDTSFEDAPNATSNTLPPSSPLDDASFDIDEQTSLDVSTNASGFPLQKRKALFNLGDQGSDEENVNESTLPKFEFGFKQRMREIDEDFDKDNSLPPASSSLKIGKALTKSVFGDASLLQNDNDDETLFSHATFISPRRATSEDVFASPSQNASGQPSLSSPGIRRSKPRKRRQRIMNSDSEPDDLPKESSSATASVSGKNIFSSPLKPRSSSTEPTTDDELPTRIVSKSKRVGSQKPNSGRPSVAPLDFTDVPSSASSIDAKKSKRDKKGKHKAPTKKDLKETIKERGRLAAQTAVSIQRTAQSSKYSTKNLLNKLSGHQSDPIEPFSSPGQQLGLVPERMAVVSPAATDASPLPRKKSALPIPDLEDSDEELPEVSEINKESKAKSQAEKLRIMKQQALAQQANAEVQVEEDDEELVISRDPKVEVKEEEDHRKATKSSRPSNARKIVAQLAHVHPAKKATVVSPRKRKDYNSVMKDSASISSTKELNNLMLLRAQDAATREKRRKEEEWTKHGGHLAQRPEVPGVGIEVVLKEIAVKGATAARSKASNQMDFDEEEDEDAEDEDWSPELRGSASPEPEEDEQENDENMEVDADEAETTMVADEGDAMDSEDADTTRVNNVRASKRNVVVSDSEEDENDENAPAKVAMNRNRQMSTSSGLATEDECDKENNTKLMYDHSEDKENTRVARHIPFVQRTPMSIFDLGNDSLSSPERRAGGEQVSPSGSRRPFQDLLSEESPKALQTSPTRLTQSFASKLQASPMPRTLNPSPTLRPLISEGSLKDLGGFSQFSQPMDDVFSAAPLQPGFSDIFESGTEVQKSPKRLGGITELSSGAESASDKNDVSKGGKRSLLRRSDTLDLTQDVLAAVQLQGAFQPSENVLNKADAVFEKEQVLMVEANMRKPMREKPELYVNDMGFLTQTKPAQGTPDIYNRPSPSQRSMANILSPIETRMSQTPRMPLRTISYSGVGSSQFDSPEEPKSLQRLRRRVSDTPPRATSVSSPTASPPSVRQPRRSQPSNAFDMLARGQQKQQRKEEKKRLRDELGGIVEDEAYESDEDALFGFAKNSADAGEEDGEELDQDLPELMDYAPMDEDVVAAEKVQEKYLEQREQDDKEVEELHKKATEGQLRKRKKGGVSVDDSDEESEDDENARARRRMKKSRQSRSDIQSLEQNDETAPFAKTYTTDLAPDDSDLQFLADESQIDDLFTSRSGPRAQGVSSEEAEEQEEEQPQTVSRYQAEQELREKIRQNTLDEDTMDPKDVSWLDDEDELQAGPRVRQVDTRQRRIPRQDTMDSSELDGPAFRQSTVPASASSRLWLVQESKSRNGGTARSVGRSAVTGQAKAKPGVARGPTRKATTGAASDASGGATKPVRTASSVLSILGDKSGSFA